MKTIIKISNILYRLKVPIPAFLIRLVEKMIWQSTKNLETTMLNIDPGLLNEIAEKKLLYFFKKAAKYVPAYARFLNDNGVDPDKIRTISQFTESIPQTTKDSYIKRYSLEERCFNGKLPKDGTIFKSAGSSGEPTIWTQSLDEENLFEVFVPFGLNYNFDINKKHYKILNCWAFGTWPTAIDFTKASKGAGQLINIGTNINEAIETLKMLGKDYDYLITGYPPFLKNLIYQGEEAGLEWKDYKINILSGGEGFVEEWRDFFRRKLRDGAIIRSAYGSTDKGLGEGVESELSIVLRNLVRICQVFLKDPQRSEDIARDFFNDSEIKPKSSELAREFVIKLLRVDPFEDDRLPMMFQYDPTTYYNEVSVMKREGGYDLREMVTTVLKDGLASPRIRYNIKDESGVIKFSDVIDQIEKVFGLEKVRKAVKYKKDFMPLPFFYIFNRSDGTVSIDGANIYPEEVGTMIESTQEIADKISSFILRITPDNKFQIDLEAVKGYILDEKEEMIYKKVFIRELPKFSHGYKALIDENLVTKDITLKLYNYGEGPFINSPLVNKGIIKYQYIGKKVTGK